MTLDLAEIASKPDWKEMLTHLVHQEGMDPWDIDIALLVEKFVASVRQMRELDFRVPANAVLAASVLLRYKSDSWQLGNGEELPMVYVPDEPYSAPEVPSLEPIMRTTQRKVSLDELITAIEDVMGKEKHKAQRQQLRAERVVPVELLDAVDVNSENFEHRLKSVYRKLRRKADAQDLTLFSELLDDGTVTEVIEHLIPLLHLANSQKIAMWQEEFFGEIFIHLLEDEHGTKAAA